MPRDYGTDGYNGWRNRATWGVSLILNNEEGYYRMVLDWIDECVESRMTREETKIYLSNRIMNLVDDEYELLDTNTWPPLMQQLIDGPYMMDIDYWEIAEGFISGYEYGKDNVWAKETPKKSPAKSQCVKRSGTSKGNTKKPSQSSNRKPRTTSSKKPTQRRR